jgi:hypothetical protein
MKSLLMSIVLLSLNHAAFADCESSFMAGDEAMRKGVLTTELVNEDFAALQEAAKENEDDTEGHCKAIKGLHYGSSKAIAHFTTANLEYRQAYMQCEGENETNAKKNQRQAEKNRESSTEFRNNMKSAYQELCGGSLPELSFDKNGKFLGVK